MKGQINIEFLAAAGLFILTLLTLITANQALPGYSQGMDQMELNLEAKTVTDTILTEEGHHTYGESGPNWDKNQSTLENTEAFGLAQENHVIDRTKLESLKTTTVDGTTALNYSQFRNATGVENQYNFEFVLMPTVQTNLSYIKGSPPSNPDIEEPELESYALADNRVHYGQISFEGRQFNMLVTSHDGVYDTMYVNNGITEEWDFTNPNPAEPYSVGDRITENGFQVESFQNRQNDEGSLVVMSRSIKEFGPTPNPDTTVITLDRYAVLAGEPLRMEVAVW